MAQTPEEKYTLIRDAIQKGRLDEFLDELGMAIDNRHKIAAQQRSYQLEPGDFIILPRNTKPRMLSNQLVIFRGQDASRLRVELTQTYTAKWKRGNIIRIPATMVAKVVKPNANRDGQP